MLLLPFSTLITAALGAATVKVRQTNTTAGAKKILIGGGPTGMVGAADFDGSKFTIVANDTIAGTSASWMLFKEPNLLYAVDENSNTTRLFNVRMTLFYESISGPRLTSRYYSSTPKPTTWRSSKMSRARPASFSWNSTRTRQSWPELPLPRALSTFGMSLRRTGL